MNKIMPHTNNLLPRGVGVTLNEFLAEHIGSLSYYLKIFDYSEIKERFHREIVTGFIFKKTLDVIDSFKNMTQS